MADEQSTSNRVGANTPVGAATLLNRALAQEPKVPTCRTHYGQHEWVTHDETGIDFCKTCSIRKDTWEGGNTANNNAEEKREPDLSKVPENLRPHVIKPGEVRNPNGRPKGSRNLTTIVMEAMRAKKLSVKLPDGTQVVLTGEQVFAEAVLENALKKKDRESLRMIWEMADGKPTQQHKLELNGPKGYEVDPAREAMILQQFDAYPEEMAPKVLESSVSVELLETTQTSQEPLNAVPTPKNDNNIPPIITNP